MSRILSLRKDEQSLMSVALNARILITATIIISAVRLGISFMCFVMLIKWKTVMTSINKNV